MKKEDLIRVLEALPDGAEVGKGVTSYEDDFGVKHYIESFDYFTILPLKSFTDEGYYLKGKTDANYIIF